MTLPDPVNDLKHIFQAIDTKNTPHRRESGRLAATRALWVNNPASGGQSSRMKS